MAWTICIRQVQFSMDSLEHQIEQADMKVALCANYNAFDHVTSTCELLMDAGYGLSFPQPDTSRIERHGFESVSGVEVIQIDSFPSQRNRFALHPLALILRQSCLLSPRLVLPLLRSRSLEPSTFFPLRTIETIV